MIVPVGVITVISLVYLWSKTLREEVRTLYHESNHVWKKCSERDVFAKGYITPWYLAFGSLFFSGSWHTLIHNALRELTRWDDLKYDRELVALSDGGTVGLDWAVSVTDSKGNVVTAPSRDDDTKPIVFFHHGLCGSSDSQYVVSAASQLIRDGKYRVVCMIARGCGGIPLTTPQGFTAARTLDMREVLATLRRRYNAPIMGVGYSLGAGLMAKYVGQEGENSVLSYACVVSPCWDFMHRSPWFEIWSQHFLAQCLVGYTQENKHYFEQNDVIDLDKALKAKYVAEYDAAAVVPVHGYKDVDHYYQSSSPIHNAHNIKIPTLAICADDDPVCSIGGCPEDHSSFGEGLIIARTTRGGHVSWAEGWFGRESWMDRAVMNWIDTCHETHQNNVQEFKKSAPLVQKGMEVQLNRKMRFEDSKKDLVSQLSAMPVEESDGSWQPREWFKFKDTTLEWGSKSVLAVSAIGFLSYKLLRKSKYL